MAIMVRGFLRQIEKQRDLAAFCGDGGICWAFDGE
jgi:hypothetical protein